MGKVIRVTLRFTERFWKDLPRRDGGPWSSPDKKNMDAMSFLLSDDDWFPTWWTMAPEKLPFLVGMGAISLRRSGFPEKTNRLSWKKVLARCIVCSASAEQNFSRNSNMSIFTIGRTIRFRGELTATAKLGQKESSEG